MGEPVRSLPRQSPEQRLAALRLANEVRLARAELKRQLAFGRIRLEEVVADPPACAATAKVYELLLAVPKIGPAKANRLLTSCRIAPTKRLTGLSTRQRHELVERLRA
jgi:S13-like H2TH domain